MKKIPILLFLLLSFFTGCTSSSSRTSNNSLIIKDKDSLSFSVEELSSRYGLFNAPGNVSESSRVKFETLFKREIVDSNLMISLAEINSCLINFLSSGLEHNSLNNVSKWYFDYEQLIKFKDDKRKCPKVVTYNDISSRDFSSMTCKDKSKSTLSVEALRFLNSKILGKYPCELEYTYEQIDSLHSLHPEDWDEWWTAYKKLPKDKQ